MNRLLNEDYVEETDKKIVDNRVRNFYSITPSGKEHLHFLQQQLNDTLATLNVILEDESDEK